MVLLLGYSILTAFLLVFGVLKIRLAAQGHFSQLVLAAVLIGLAVWPAVQIVERLASCSCGL